MAYVISKLGTGGDYNFDKNEKMKKYCFDPFKILSFDTHSSIEVFSLFYIQIKSIIQLPMKSKEAFDFCILCLHY